MLPGQDQYRLRNGKEIYGCQVQVMALDTLLGNAYPHAYDRRWVVARVCIWCIVAALLATLLPVRPNWPARICAVAGVACLYAADELVSSVAWNVTQTWKVEGGIALSAFLAVAGLILPLRVIRARQLQLTPGPIWPAEGTTGGTTTVVTETSSTHA
jgi:hypothetical protein